MGVRNYLVEGVTCTGKSSVCRELRRRGFAAVDGDNDLAYQGDPETGLPVEGFTHEHHIWAVDRVQALVADPQDDVTYFCGGSRNFPQFVDLFDAVFVLQVDAGTLAHRLDARRGHEWGAVPEQRELVIRLHRTQEDVPAGIGIDATAPLEHVVDEILRLSAAPRP